MGSCVIWLKLISYVHVLRNVYFLTLRIKRFENDIKTKNNSLNEVITEAEASSDVKILIK